MINSDNHSQNDQEEFIYCPIPGCKKVFLYQSEVERHQITHNNSKPYVCPHEDCIKSFKRQDALRVHLQNHSTELQFFCSIPGCEAKFKAKTALKYHLSKHKKSELQEISNSSGHQKAPFPKAKSKEILAKRKFSRCQSTEEEFNPTKLLFLQEGETRSNSSTRSTRTIRQEIMNNPNDKELLELKSLLKCLAKENKELKSKFEEQKRMKESQDLEDKFKNQMISFFETDTYFNSFLE